jgi:AbrB family looped-hinge helix DNA binding protein
MTNKAECCKVDAVVTIDSRGQLVLPKDVRERAKLKPNDKLAVVSFERDGEVYCIIIVKAEKFENTIKSFLSPMLKEVFK